jgi:hypothetical protein
MRTLNITIPKPCHENWNTMSPQEQGRFCDKCCKTVVDFSTKSPVEVRQILLERKNEKVCGRFNNDQLAPPVQLNFPLHSFGNRLSAAQVFLLALLFVFGTTLFSCTTQQGEVVGKLAISDVPIEDPGKDEYIMIGAVVSSAQVLLDEPELETESKSSPLKFNPPEPEPDTPHTLPEVQVTAEAIESRTFHTVGLVYRSITDGEFAQQPETDSTKAERVYESPESPVPETILLYPNPSPGIVNLKLNLTAESSVQAELFEMSGRLLRTIIPSRMMQAEENEIQFDIGDLPPAAYLVRVVIGKEVVVKRVVRE